MSESKYKKLIATTLSAASTALASALSNSEFSDYLAISEAAAKLNKSYLEDNYEVFLGNLGNFKEIIDSNNIKPFKDQEFNRALSSLSVAVHGVILAEDSHISPTSLLNLSAIMISFSSMAFRLLFVPSNATAGEIGELEDTTQDHHNQPGDFISPGFDLFDQDQQDHGKTISNNHGVQNNENGSDSDSEQQSMSEGSQKPTKKRIIWNYRSYKKKANKNKGKKNTASTESAPAAGATTFELVLNAPEQTGNDNDGYSSQFTPGYNDNNEGTSLAHSLQNSFDYPLQTETDFNEEVLQIQPCNQCVKGAFETLASVIRNCKSQECMSLIKDINTFLGRTENALPFQ